MEIKIEIMDVVRKCMLKINSTHTSVALFYHTVKSFEGQVVPPLETDGLPIVVTSDKPKSNSEIKESALNWLYQKAFEDFIVGLNESLIEAYIITKLVELEKEQHQTKEEVEMKLNSIYKKPKKMHVPELIDKIEESIGKSLFLRNEILSINKVRNCFVHRNGKVSVDDTNNPSKDALILICSELKVYRDKDAGMIPITKEDKSKGVHVKKASFQVLPLKIEFPIQTEVKINPEILNAVIYTSITFVQELLKAMPINFQPQEMEFEIS